MTRFISTETTPIRKPRHARPHHVLASVASVMLLLAPAVASAAPVAGYAPDEMGVPTSLPTAQHSGNVSFITGGIGEEERNYLAQEKKNYNLHITSSGTAGQFVGDTQVNIRNSAGQTVLSGISGPLFYAKLPAGSYVVESSVGDQKITRNVTIGSNSASNIDLRWKATS